MTVPLARAAPPSDDRRWKFVEARMRRLGYRPDALIETLHTVQESFGYLELDALSFVSDALHVPRSRVFGVATFYSLFTLKPHGEHTCVVCTGTACYLNGAPKLLRRLGDDLGIEPGETTPDGRISLLTAHCIGACSIAPAFVVDGQVRGQLDPDDVLTELATL
jgi:bidirectional [NiFe] hydrogenase diaphorase subunit